MLLLMWPTCLMFDARNCWQPKSFTFYAANRRVDFCHSFFVQLGRCNKRLRCLGHLIHPIFSITVICSTQDQRIIHLSWRSATRCNCEDYIFWMCTVTKMAVSKQALTNHFRRCKWSNYCPMHLESPKNASHESSFCRWATVLIMKCLSGVSSEHLLHLLSTRALWIQERWILPLDLHNFQKDSQQPMLLLQPGKLADIKENCYYQEMLLK